MSNKKPTYQDLENQIIELEKIQLEATISQDNQYRMLFDSMTEMVDTIELIYDKNGLPIDWYIRDINLSFAKFLGKTKDQLINKKVSSIIGTIEDYWLTSFASVNKTGTPVSFTNYGVEFDKYYYVTAWKVSKNRVGLSFTDVTEQKRIEKDKSEAHSRLEKSEERFRVLTQNMEAGIVVHAPDTSIVQNNIRASEILGLSDDQLKGKTAMDSEWKFVKLDKSPLPFTEYPVNRIATSKISIKNQVAGLFQPDKDDIVWVKINGFPMLNSTGDITEIVISFIDITEQRLFEEAQVKHQRLKAIGEMSSSIAHDFNNSLQGMIANLEIVKFENDLSDSVLERLNNVGAIIGDVAGRVSALQKFGDTKHDDKNTRLLDFNTLIEETLKQSRPLWKDGMGKEGLTITVKTVLKDIPKIHCNSGELKSAIYNLIKNSIEAMLEGGDLIIKTGIKAKGIFATFTDTGMGMNEEASLKIFQPFYSTKGFGLGRGLGMSGVYSTVKKHKGDIVVKSSVLDEGTTIEMVLPIS